MVNTSKLIRLKPDIKSKLDNMKQHKRETYGDVIERLLDCWR